MVVTVLWQGHCYKNEKRKQRSRKRNGGEVEESRKMIIYESVAVLRAGLRCNRKASKATRKKQNEQGIKQCFFISFHQNKFFSLFFLLDHALFRVSKAQVEIHTEEDSQAIDSI